MNQQHKKIAEIMYKIGCMDFIVTAGGNKEELWTPENVALHKLTCIKLADVLEEEAKCKNCGTKKIEHDDFVHDFNGDFNRTQFLKTAGCEK